MKSEHLRCHFISVFFFSVFRFFFFLGPSGVLCTHHLTLTALFGFCAAKSSEGKFTRLLTRKKKKKPWAEEVCCCPWACVDSLAGDECVSSWYSFKVYYRWQHGFSWVFTDSFEPHMVLRKQDPLATQTNPRNQLLTSLKKTGGDKDVHTRPKSSPRSSLWKQTNGKKVRSEDERLDNVRGVWKRGGTYEYEEVKDEHEVLDTAETVALHGRASRRGVSLPLWTQNETVISVQVTVGQLWRKEDGCL